jgi:hypothetical protein
MHCNVIAHVSLTLFRAEPFFSSSFARKSEAGLESVARINIVRRNNFIYKNQVVQQVRIVRACLVTYKESN